MPQSFHEHACYAAEFARCAGEQGAYWKAVDYLFTLPAIEEKKSAQVVRRSIYNGWAALDLDEQALKECLDSDR